VIQAWAACLDALEAHLRYQHAALDQGRPELIAPFVPSDELGPLPTSLAPRARALADDARTLEVRLGSLTAAHARQLQLVAVLDRTAHGAPSFVDARG
jgi:hypothetical protein